jgi:hypothetical protein
MRLRFFQQNLFGGKIPAEEVVLKEWPVSGKYRRFRAERNYRKAKLGQWSYICCATCMYFRKVHRLDSYYFKCVLMGVSASRFSDIRKGCVCDSYSEIPKSENIPGKNEMR